MSGKKKKKKKKTIERRLTAILQDVCEILILFFILKMITLRWCKDIQTLELYV
jgi:hypothetical protein